MGINIVKVENTTLLKNVYILGRGYFPEVFQEIAAYFPEDFQEIVGYFPEDFWEIVAYFPEEG